MAIQFARIEFVNRAKGGKACVKGAYNSRDQVKEFSSGRIYNFPNRAKNLYHKVFLPEYADRRFLDVAELMNEVEKSEQRKNSKLLKEVVVALPKEELVGNQGREEILENFIKKMGWVKEGLGVQADIHPPHGEKEKNFHAHILVTTRRFKLDGSGLGEKARDLEPKFRHGGGRNFIIKEDEMISEKFRKVQEDYFKKEGLELRVDAISKYPEIRIGPKRFRTKSAAKLVKINEARRSKNFLEIVNKPDVVVDRISERQLIFTEGDVRSFLRGYGIDSEKIVAKVFGASNIRKVVCMHRGKERFLGQYVKKEAWEQVERIMRTADKISRECQNVKLANGHEKSYVAERVEIISNMRKYDNETRDALYQLAMSESGVKVLQGVAGSGKTRILAGLSEVYCLYGVVGIAPTNKAVNVLRERGFEKVDTIAGFLWKLEHGKSKVAKHSIVMVDEAGMVSNGSYDRLFSLAQKNKFSIVLCGDERQLSSVERGGVFDRLSENYSVLKITRIQRQGIGVNLTVARLLADGKIREAVYEAASHRRITASKDFESSINSLVTNWSKSKFALEEKLVLAVSNREVEILNSKLRESVFGKDSWDLDVLLKKEVWEKSNVGDGYEKRLIAERYREGDRIVFTGNNKDLGIYNGDFASLVSIRKTSRTFCIKLDRGGVLKEFDPVYFGDFRYGYASTVYKAQGATVKDVHILHNGHSNKKNSYVSLTRHSDQFTLYCNHEATKSLDDLASQLGSDREVMISSNHRVINKYENLRRVFNRRSRIGKIFMNILDKSENIHKWVSDKINVERSESLDIKRDVVKTLEFQDVIKAEQLEQKIVKTKKETVEVKKSVEKVKSKRDFVSVLQVKRVRELLKTRSKEIGLGVLLGRGEVVNKALSSLYELRFGKSGNLSLMVGGERRGTWYDFKLGYGGDLISLVQREKNLNFKDSVRYIDEIYGDKNSLKQEQVVHTGQNKKTEKRLVQKNLLETRKKVLSKQEKVERQYKHTKELDVLGKAYFKGRGIRDIESLDVRSGRSYDVISRKYYPSVVVFARDSRGYIRGGQFIYLQKRDAVVSKADVKIKKRSFGKIKSSFVYLGMGGKNRESDITFISEGIENGLSVKVSGVKGRFLASLGINNIRNYDAAQGEKIVLICDNDGEKKTSAKIYLQAKEVLVSKGASVVLVKPQTLGDYNDLLQRKGSVFIKRQFDSEIEKLEKLYKVDLFFNKFLEKNKDKVVEIKNLDPKFVLKKQNSLDEKQANILYEQAIDRKFLEYSSKSLGSNRELLQEKNLVKVGDVISREFEIRENLAKKCPKLSEHISSKYGKSVRVSIAKEELAHIVNRLNKFVQESRYKEEVLQILKNKGMDYLLTREWRICQQAVNAKMDQDLKILKRKGVVQDFEGKEFVNKRGYVDSISKDKELQQMVEIKEVQELMHRQSLNLGRRR